MTKNFQINLKGIAVLSLSLDLSVIFEWIENFELFLSDVILFYSFLLLLFFF